MSKFEKFWKENTCQQVVEIGQVLLSIFLRIKMAAIGTIGARKVTFTDTGSSLDLTNVKFLVTIVQKK